MQRVAAVFAFALAACAGSAAEPATTEATPAPSAAQAPETPTGPLSPRVESAVARVLADLFTSSWEVDAVRGLAAAGDARTAWLLADLMRFHQTGDTVEVLVGAFSELTGVPPRPDDVEFVWATNLLISWDLPAWDGYADAKRQVFVPIDERWATFFDDAVDVDWRLVTWGGVLADGRPLDDNGLCNCIPALDHPPTTDAAGGDWYDDDRIVFGVVVGDEAVALPKHQMEIHEMLNLTLGGRELGIPYCTLCGSAQAYYTDDVTGVDRVVLRTSGLLQRSNKLMYDLNTGSAFDTFTGEAITGPLARDGVVLEQVSVVAATWGDWKSAHPRTRILAEDGGIGRVYADDPLRGRDDAGPIFPVGDVDPRLPAQEKVVGVLTPDGTPVAFPVNATRAALVDGELGYLGLTVRHEDSIRVYTEDGVEVVSHEAFWFAWSQFHEDTVVWSPAAG